MKIDFDQLRINIAREYNAIVIDYLDGEDISNSMLDLRNSIFLLLNCYDDSKGISKIDYDSHKLLNPLSEEVK